MEVDESGLEKSLSDPAFLFNEPGYLSISPEKTVSFYLKNRHSGSISGFCHFQCQHQTAWSPLHAPFASVYLFEEIGFKVIGGFVRSMTDHLANNGINRIHLSHYPDFYSVSPPDKLIAAILFEGFRIRQTDINHYLKITGKPFGDSVRPMQNRRIRKCERLGYIFKRHKNNDLEFLFSRIQEFRMQKNIPVNISMDRLRSLCGRFPERYHLFSIQDKGRIIAATLVVSVNSSVLYNFLPASDEQYSTSSPMAFLIRHLYDYAAENHYQYIDLGVSSIRNQPQSGLITFKENLGGLPGIKFQLEKTFGNDHV